MHLMLQIEEEYLARLRYISKRYAHNCLEYQDIYQDLILTLYIKIKSGKIELKDNATVKAKMICHAMDLYNREKQNRRKDTRYNTKESVIMDQASIDFLEQEIVDLLHKHLEELPAQVFICYLFPHRKTIKQVSQKLAISPGTIKRLINTTKAQLYKLLIGVYTEPNNS